MGARPGDKGPATHAVATTPTGPATKLDKVKSTLAGDALRQITNYYNGNHEAALAFATAAIEYVRKVPKLLDCDRTSLVMAIVTAAQFRFMPSNVAGEAYIIPYGTEAKFQIGYQGYVTLLYRTGKIATIMANIVYEHDHFVHEEGLEPRLEHKPAKFGKERGEPIGVYTVVEMKGGAKTFKVMDRDEVMAIKEMSKAKAKKDSPWNSGDPELWMWKKTCLIQHAKLLPKTPDLTRAMEVDFEGEGMEAPRLDAGGIAARPAHHDPAKIAPLPKEDVKEAPPAEAEDDGAARCEKHPDTKLDGDGECPKCVADALAKEEGVIEA